MRNYLALVLIIILYGIIYLQQRKDNNVSSELSKLKIIYDDIAIIEQDLESLIKLKSEM